MIKVDLHSHILPGMDDGAENTNVSLGLLQKEAEQGIEHIVLTPHFNPRNDNVSDFVERREKSFEQLKNSLSGTESDGLFDFRLAAEVRYSPSLTDEKDLDALCISGTKTLLIEFSMTHQPEFVEEVFYRLQLRGYVILMAHVERFSWLRKDPEILYNLVSGGAFAQFNADQILKDNSVYSFVKKMLKNGLLHGIGSDAHNLDIRPPRIHDAEKLLSADSGSKYIDKMNDFALDLIAGGIPDADTPVKPRKSFWDFLLK